MVRRWRWAGLAPVLAAALFLLTPSTSQAWGWRAGTFGYGDWYGPYYSGYGGPAYAGYPYYSGFGYTPLLYTYYGFYPGYTNYSAPASIAYTYPSSTYVYPSGGNYVSYYLSSQTNGANNPNDAWIRVEVPADAEVWFGNYKTTQTGRDRLFYSPPLDPTRNYSYEVRARWVQNGQVVDRARNVPVAAGQSVTVDFLQPEGSGRAISQPQPTEATPPAVPRGEIPVTTPADRSASPRTGPTPRGTEWR